MSRFSVSVASAILLLAPAVSLAQCTKGKSPGMTRTAGGAGFPGATGGKAMGKSGFGGGMSALSGMAGRSGPSAGAMTSGFQAQLQWQQMMLQQQALLQQQVAMLQQMAMLQSDDILRQAARLATNPMLRNAAIQELNRRGKLGAGQ